MLEMSSSNNQLSSLKEASDQMLQTYNENLAKCRVHRLNSMSVLIVCVADGTEAIYACLSRGRK